MVKVIEVINWADGLAAKGLGYDADGAYPNQCVDLPNGASKRFFGKAMWGNGIDYLNSARAVGYRVERSGLPLAGAWFVTGGSAGYGHVGLIVEDVKNRRVVKTIEMNVDGGIYNGGPARRRQRTMDGIIGWFYMPYEDLGAKIEKKVNSVLSRDIHYGGNTLSKANVQLLAVYADKYNILPSGMICQLYSESHWGNSNTGRLDNNWAGMTGTAQTRPSGVVVTTGTARPANEGGYYMRYANMDDFFNDWTYLLHSSIYGVVGAKTFNDHVAGLFRPKAKYDYGAIGYQGYLPLMQGVRNGINNSNDGILDQLDNAFRNGTLVSGIGAKPPKPKERESDSMDFTFNVKGEPDFDPGTMYYYNGMINMIQPIHNTEELKYLRIIYKETKGRDLKNYNWTNKAPVYRRIFGTLQPGSPDENINTLIKKLIEQVNSEI